MFSGNIFHDILDNLLGIHNLTCHCHQLLTYNMVSADIFIGIFDDTVPSDIIIGPLNETLYQKQFMQEVIMMRNNLVIMLTFLNDRI